MHGSNAASAGQTLRLRQDRYKALTEAKGWQTHEEQARGLGLAQSTISRTLRGADHRGGQGPGPTFIAALLTTFPEAKFEDLFDVVEVARLRRVS